MTGKLTTCDGAAYELPALYEWELTYTGGVPCDSFSLRCAYDASMAEPLRRATRFTAYEGASVAFCGVVDEYAASCDEAGMWLEFSGRGMAALLLDNEAEAANYQQATTAELLRNHVLPYGIACGAYDAVSGGDYAVASGSSEWKALSEFTRYYGGFLPYFRKDGTLVLQRARTKRSLTLGDDTVVTAISYRDKRYGVVSEVVVVDRRTRARLSVRNEAFRARGGQCRRVSYVPSNSTYRRARYTGEYQIARSKEGGEELTIEVLGFFDADPGDTLQIASSALGVTGTFAVSEAARRFGPSGETTTLTLERE